MIDLKKYKGEVSVGEILFKYSVSNAPINKRPHTHALKVSMIDPETAEIMQDKFKIDRALLKLNKEIDTTLSDEKKEEISAEIEKIIKGKKKYNVEKYKYLYASELNVSTIRKYAVDCAKELYTRYERELMKKLKTTPRVGHVSAIQLFNLYGKDYLFSLGACAPRTVKDKERILRGACGELGVKPVTSLTEKELTNLFSKEKYFKKRKLISNFFDFCKTAGPFMAANPISAFLEGHNSKKKGKKLKFYPKNSRHLSFDQESELIRLMEEHKTDNEIMAVALAKYARLSLTQIKEMVWGDIIIDNGRVMVKIMNEKTAGNLHDYTRPILGGGEQFIIERYNEALNKVGDVQRFKNKKIIKQKKNENHNNDHLTKYIRSIIFEANVTADEINAAAPNTRELGGAGVALLHDHYDYVLQTRCGVGINSPIGKFLRGYNPGDIMHTHYRSLTDTVSGIPYLQVIMRRDDIFDKCKGVNTVKAQVEVKDGITYIRIPAAPPGKKLNVILPEIEIKRGTEIVLTSQYGLHGEIMFQALNEVDNPVNERIIY